MPLPVARLPARRARVRADVRAGVNGVLLDILVVLVAAKVAAEGAERIGLPAVVGEILAGLAIGPSALGLVEPSEVLHTLGELGVILLLLQVGLEMDLGELGAVGRSSMLVAVAGVALPFVAGWAVATAFGESTNTAIFVGAALTATSVGITARVFGDLRALASIEARTVLGAAVADDVIGLVILTVVVRLVSEGSISALSVLGVAGMAVAFLVVTTGVGIRVAPRLFSAVHRLSRSPGTLVGVAFAFTLAVAGLASAAKLATVVGAFVAGLSLARTDQAERIRRDLTPVGHLFVPVFFLQIGIDADVAALLRPSVLTLAGALLVVAVIGKVLAGWAALGSKGDRLLIGLGMLPRGEVGLIFAGLGLREGILGDDVYAAMLLVVLVTTVVTPPLLSLRLRRVQASARAAVAGVPTPAGGWLVAQDGLVDLRAGEGGAVPPPHEAIRLGLRAAVDLRHARPGPALLDWLGSLGPGAQQWDPAARGLLFELLREGNARSWRFLEITGLLDRALPELAEALRRRAADASELDPAFAVRFQLVDRAHELIDGAGPAATPHPERLVLAALLVEVGAGVATARQVVKRLDLGAAAEQDIAVLVGESGLLRAAAARPDGLAEERVVQIASHLGSPERARALYLLSQALGDLEAWEHQRLDVLHELVQAALALPEVAGREVRNLAQQRLAAACRVAGAGTAAARRLEHAPQAWLLAHEPDDLARLATLVEPLPGRDEVRVQVRPGGRGQWRVELACRDRVGRLAAITAALAGAGLDVLDASIAGWADGGVADAFTVRSDSEPDAGELRRLVAAGRAEATPPVQGAVVTFDSAALPWHTLCVVEAPDRPGLLHALATAFAASGADVHRARITTAGTTAKDHFELTDGRGEKLGRAAEEAIRAALASGVGPSRRARAGLTRPRARGRRARVPPSPDATGVEDLATS